MFGYLAVRLVVWLGLVYGAGFKTSLTSFVLLQVETFMVES